MCCHWFVAAGQPMANLRRSEGAGIIELAAEKEALIQCDCEFWGELDVDFPCQQNPSLISHYHFCSSPVTGEDFTCLWRQPCRNVYQQDQQRQVAGVQPKELPKAIPRRVLMTRRWPTFAAFASGCSSEFFFRSQTSQIDVDRTLTYLSNPFH